MVFWVPIIAWIAALVCAGLAVARAPSPRGVRLAADRLLRYINLFPVGLIGLWAALGHIAFPEESARAIGWAASPFQFEVGVANLGIGLAGIIAAIWPNWGFRAAIAVMTTGFLGGAAIGHLVQIAETGNLAAGNAGPILYTDVLTPLSLLLLLALTFRSAPARG
ncbi:DUF6790 family protein [Xanthobacter agilis]|uniref:DUF4345 domain-containing protein n=1 Tax=Xanthobacter agilis TaxID=47492 RepID=A0ABU0LG47_XANAG|nr:DUF6790 family protein [Xanthobacter agilis]MDQ0506103.1 hypothetical protein [Xanthobacter agilis]